MIKKYQIFISSTYTDLIEERATLIKACLDFEHIPVGMEMFVAGNQAQWEVIEQQIEQVDYFVSLVAHRYGSRPDKNLPSYTEMEYDYATSKGIPVMGLVINPDTNWNPNSMDKEPEDLEALQKFKAKIKTKMIMEWEDKKDIAKNFTLSLNKLIQTSPRPGWERCSGSSLTQSRAHHYWLGRDIVKTAFNLVRGDKPQSIQHSLFQAIYHMKQLNLEHLPACDQLQILIDKIENKYLSNFPESARKNMSSDLIRYGSNTA
ncbi:MAG TPA: hypothetical protein DDZ90_21355, partial [Planctomycetaceae bacterium]|nr:hypothetical protein [Planctomycetaceae bacterium]